jgi:hypothetical protein
MPQAFLDCVNNGGKVRTIKIGKDGKKYMHVCYLNGQSFAGEIRTKEEKPK